MSVRLSFGGKFQIWEYRVSHSELVIRRSELSKDGLKEVKFVGVSAMNVISVMCDLEIVEVAECDGVAWVGKVEGDRCFRLASGAWSGWVIAAGIGLRDRLVDQWTPC